MTSLRCRTQVLLALKAELEAAEAAASAGGLDFSDDFFAKPAFLTVSLP